MQQYSGGQQFGAGFNTLSQFATNPQQVRQHIAEDLSNAQYGGQAFAGMGQFGGAMGAGMNAGGYMPVRQGSVQQGAMGQVMNSIPAQVRGQQGQMMGQFSQQQYPQQFSNSTFGQFGSDPQLVRQHIQEDLAYGQGSMSSQQAGGFRGQGFGQAGMMQNQGYGQAGMMQGGQGFGASSTLGQFATNPQQVRQHIQEDLNAGFGMGGGSFQ